MDFFGNFRFATIVNCSVAAVLFTLSPAAADKRVALVIDNADYTGAAKLVNPTNDAAAIAGLFRQVGFEVVERTNVGIRELRQTIDNFSDLARNADVAVVYYSGHGIEVDGLNYLIPVDAILDRDTSCGQNIKL
jgi:uncharacterized caspase-like protein